MKQNNIKTKFLAQQFLSDVGLRARVTDTFTGLPPGTFEILGGKHSFLGKSYPRITLKHIPKAYLSYFSSY